jgi:hypothetical protein
MKDRESKVEPGEAYPPAPCWAVYFTRRWGQPDNRKHSIDLAYQDCREHLRILRKMERQSKMGHRYAMRRKPNTGVRVK